MARKHKKSQRALAVVAAIGGMTKEEADSMLAEVGYPQVTPSSWDMLTSRYSKIFLAMPHLIGKCIDRPRSIADLIAEAAAGSNVELDIPITFEGDEG